MIKLTKFDGKEIFINAEKVLYVEGKPDTIITLTSGEVIVVKEGAEEVVKRIVEYKREIATPKGD